jgi:hypothetical protein
MKNYELPKTKMRKREEKRQKGIWRTTPRPLEPRLERHLTIGREIIAEKDSGEENIQKCKGDKCLQSRKAFFRIKTGKKAPEELKIGKVKMDMPSLDDLTESDPYTITCEMRRRENRIFEFAKEKNEYQLTELVQSKKIEAGKTDDQLQSYLFKLPLEIRRQIWEETLGGYVFHIYFVQAYRRMSHTRCKTRLPAICKNDDPISGPCRQLFKVPGAPDKWGHSNILSILQSCRRM